MKLSVIIPIYNGEKYLRDCLNSIDFQDVGEILLINDGSSDKTGEICDEFAAANPIFRHVVSPHGGVSRARNLGLSLALCEYVCFVDADDLCRGGMHRRLLGRAESQRADLCFCGFQVRNHNLTRAVGGFNGLRYVEGRGSAVAAAMCRDDLSILLPTLIVRRELLVRHRIRFTEDCKYGEDDEFTLHCLMCADHVSAVREPLYLYRLSPENSTAKYGVERLQGCLAALRLLNRIRSEFPDETVVPQALERFFIPARIVDVLYIHAAAGVDYDAVCSAVSALGLSSFVRPRIGARPAIFALTCLWRLSPRLLYRAVRFKTKF